MQIPAPYELVEIYKGVPIVRVERARGRFSYGLPLSQEYAFSREYNDSRFVFFGNDDGAAARREIDRNPDEIAEFCAQEFGTDPTAETERLISAYLELQAALCGP